MNDGGHSYTYVIDHIMRLRVTLIDPSGMVHAPGPVSLTGAHTRHALGMEKYSY